MLAVPDDLPSAREDERWGYETKWDGVRILAFFDRGELRLRSRNDLDVSVSYPELQGLGEQLGTSQVVLDGEVVAFGTDGRPSFARLQKRMHVGRHSDAMRLSGTDPVRYLVFDVLHLNGSATTELPYHRRRELLEGLDINGSHWQTPPYFSGGGEQLLRASQQLGLEGVVAKRLESRYLPGRRSSDWRKIKNVRSQEVVVVGWKPGNGRRAGTIGSVLLAVPGPDGLHYAGKVGTGFSDAALTALHARLAPLGRPSTPVSTALTRLETLDAHWVQPSLVAEVAFSEWTPDDRLRHPVWRGLRPDKSVDEVRRES
jgi:bifunctional non-homologous end joining protein LigD